MIGDHLTVKDAPVVFVGYGVKAPERNWDDFKGMDLKGKVALVLVNDPDFETGQGDFGGKAMTYYGRWTYKFEEAARQGAIGFLVIHETAPAVLRLGHGQELQHQRDLRRHPQGPAHRPRAAGRLGPEATAPWRLLKAAGLDFDALKKQAQTRGLQARRAEGRNASPPTIAVDAQKVVSKNVVGAVPGAKHPDERVIYTAHWDHLGVGLPDAKGDKIYNGALDNASGTSMLLELGRTFAKGPKPDRTVVFMSVTAEEKGLLGSEYYAVTPLYPLATTVGVTQHGRARPQRPGQGLHHLGQCAADPAGRADRRWARPTTATTAPTRGPRRAASSARTTSPSPRSACRRSASAAARTWSRAASAAGIAKRTAYTANQYHQPADEFDPSWDPKGFEADGTLLFELGQKLANSRLWPEWKTGRVQGRARQDQG